MPVKSVSTVGLVACVLCRNVFLREKGGGECPACGSSYGGLSEGGDRDG